MVVGGSQKPSLTAFRDCLVSLCVVRARACTILLDAFRGYQRLFQAVGGCWRMLEDVRCFWRMSDRL